MKVIAQPKQTGKTTALIEWAAEPETPGEPRYICVATQQRARYVANLADEMGYNIRFPVTHDELLHRHHNGRRLEVAVDDAEELIARVLAPQRVSVVAMTAESD